MIFSQDEAWKTMGGSVATADLFGWVDKKLIECISNRFLLLGPWISRGFTKSVKIGLTQSVNLRSTVFQTGEDEYLCLVPLGLVIRLDYLTRLLERESSETSFHMVDPDFYGDLPEEMRVRRALRKPPPPIDIMATESVLPEDFWRRFEEIDRQDEADGRSVCREAQIDVLRQAVTFCALHETAHALRSHHSIVHSRWKGELSARRGAELDADSVAGEWLASFNLLEAGNQLRVHSEPFRSAMLVGAWRLTYGVCLVLGLFDIDRLAIGDFLAEGRYNHPADGAYNHPSARLTITSRGIIRGFGPAMGEDLSYKSIMEASRRAVTDYTSRADNLMIRLARPYPAGSFRRVNSIYVPMVHENMPGLMDFGMDQDFPTLRRMFRKASEELKKFLSANDDLLSKGTCLGLELDRYVTQALEYCGANDVSQQPRSFGTENPIAASDLTNLAMLLSETNRSGDCERLFRGALAMNEKSFGRNHTKVARDLTNLAFLLTKMKQFGEAESLYRRALAIDESSLGLESGEVAKDLTNLAFVLTETGRFDEVVSLSQRALTIVEKNPEVEHSETVDGVSRLAMRFTEVNCLEEAEALFRRVLTIAEKCLGQGHLEVPMHNLAMVLTELNRFEEAESLYRRVLAIQEKRLEPNHPDLIRNLNNLGVCLTRLGRHAEALEPIQQSVGRWEQLVKERPDTLLRDSSDPECARPDWARSLDNLATCLTKLERYEEALEITRKALRIQYQLAREQPDIFRPRLASSLNNLAGYYRMLGQREEALEIAKEATSIREQLAKERPEAFRPDWAKSLYALACCLQDMDQHADALNVAQQASLILEEQVQERPTLFWVETLVKSLGVEMHCLRELNRVSEAAETKNKAIRLVTAFLTQTEKQDDEAAISEGF